MQEYGREDEYRQLADRLMKANETLPEEVRPSREYVDDFVRRSTVEDSRRFVEMCERDETIPLSRLVDVVTDHMADVATGRN